MSQSEQPMLRNYRNCFADDAEHQGLHCSTCHAHEVPLMKKVAAEFVATFILIFSAAATPIVDQKYSGVEALTGKAVSAAAPVTVMIISMGHISGAHMNPSVTLALAVFKHFPLLNVAPYMVAQVLGSISASFVLKAIFSPFHSGKRSDRNNSWDYCFDECFHCRAINRGINEPCEDIGTGSGSRELQPYLGVHGGPNSRGYCRHWNIYFYASASEKITNTGSKRLGFSSQEREKYVDS